MVRPVLPVPAAAAAVPADIGSGRSDRLCLATGWGRPAVVHLVLRVGRLVGGRCASPTAVGAGVLAEDTGRGTVPGLANHQLERGFGEKIDRLAQENGNDCCDFY